jgi:cytoskeletal protein RodZ
VSIGEALAEARRQAGLTVTEVSQRTRIREPIITGIEGDDYSACGGDFYARGHIRSIAQAVGTDPEPLVREYDAARLGPEGLAEDVTEPVAAIRMPERRLLSWITLLGLVLIVGLGFVAYRFLAGSADATSAAPSARADPVTHGPTSAGRADPTPTSTPTTPTPTPTPTTTSPAAVPAPALPPVRVLPPVSAAAFGPNGGDDPQRAGLAIDHSSATAWHTDWYATAHFGNLYRGTGLLVDMGRQVTITAVQVTLGSAPGADVQLRVGGAPALADLPAVARAANAAGVVQLRPATPAHGRYLLIWFTSLPLDRAGTFQASVYDLRLEGRP